MPHLFDGHVDQHTAPAFHGTGLLCGHPIRLAILEAEGGVKVGAHEVVLELRGLVESVEGMLSGDSHGRRGYIGHRNSRHSGRKLTGLAEGDVGPAFARELEIHAPRGKINQRAAMIAREVVMRLGAELLEFPLITTANPPRRVNIHIIEYTLHAV